MGTASAATLQCIAPIGGESPIPAVTTREARQRRHYFDQIGRGVRSGRTAGSRAGEHTAPRLFLQGAKRGLVSAREFRDAAGYANISRQPPMRIRKGTGAAAHSQFA